jgi:carbonic anhydrase
VPPPAEQLCLANVLQQLDNLLGHPVVHRAVEDGRLRLFGLYFDLAAAQMYLYDAATGRFEPVDAPAEDLTEACAPAGAAAGAGGPDCCSPAAV